MEQDIIKPGVNHAQEFIEIAFDFANPLDLVREAISNAFDAGADHIKLGFDTVTEHGKELLRIIIEDNGSGMDKDDLQSFFDLGNSTRRKARERGDTTSFIGEKGHGTKIYFNSERVEVETQKNNTWYKATMLSPHDTLHDGRIPDVHINMEKVDDSSHYTKIALFGYNGNRLELFNHDRLKDYILWFTKMGSVEKEFGITTHENVILELKGLDKEDGYDSIPFGHVFPARTLIKDLIKDHGAQAPKYYCGRFPANKVCYSGSLPHFPNIKYSAVFYVEGDNAKHENNAMLRWRGTIPLQGAYTVQERYGLWVCKDNIPVQRKNEWISKKGNEYTKFHAFINCQALKLTANRGSIENTPTAIIDDLQAIVEKHYDEIIKSNEYGEMSDMEAAAVQYNTKEKEKNDYKRRIKRINKAQISEFEDLTLIVPQQENGVYSMFLQISQKHPDLFPFTIIDYDTHSGIDVIVKERDKVSLEQSKLYYVEFKNILQQQFNHSFENLHSIVCWDVGYVNGQDIPDITDGRVKRILRIIPPRDENDYTRYFLEDERSSKKIEVFVLKTYLKEKLGIEFRPRTMKECY